MHFFRKKTTQERFFNHWAPGYENSLRHYDYVVPQVLFEAVWPYVRDRSGQGPLRLLDIGIGTGLSAQPFHDTGRVFITGIDVSEKMLAQCRRRGLADELIHIDASCGDLPFPPQSFDIIVAGGTVEFIDDTERLFEEMTRLIRPGGIIAITHEVPETKTLYPRGLTEGVLEDEKDRVIVQRSFTRHFVPRTYLKYLYSPRLMEDRYILNGIAIVESREFTAYRWSGGRNITYNLIVGQKR